MKNSLLALALFVSPAFAQEHIHPDEIITDSRVAHFYETWRQPNQRRMSCCAKRDCYAAQVRRQSGAWEYLHKWSGRWYRIPDHVIESNAIEPRDSPDGQNHVCASPYDGQTVYCAVLSNGL